MTFWRGDVMTFWDVFAIHAYRIITLFTIVLAFCECVLRQCADRARGS